MQDKDSVLIMHKGKEYIARPGPGGYKIEWSPGTKLVPLKTTKSGHIVIPCDKFNKATEPKAEDQLGFDTDHRNNSTASSSNS